MRFLALLSILGMISSGSVYAAKACYVGKKFQGFPCSDGGRIYTSAGHSKPE